MAPGPTLMTMKRTVAWMMLASGCLAASGCLDSVLGVMLAPEAVAAGAAGGVAQAGADSLGTTLDQLSTTSQAIKDIDRILGNVTDPAAQERLSGLRDKLVENQAAAEGTSSLSSVTYHEPVFELRRPNDGMNGPPRPRRSDRVVVDPPGVNGERRPPARPDVLAENATLQPDRPQGFTISLQPVRLGR